jgi:hypothetical protein
MLCEIGVLTGPQNGQAKIVEEMKKRKKIQQDVIQSTI